MNEMEEKREHRVLAILLMSEKNDYLVLMTEAIHTNLATAT